MRNIAFFLILAAGILLSVNSFAYQTSTPDPKSREMIDAAAKTEEIKTILASMECTKLVWAKVASGGQIIQMQFMPEELDDDELREWTRMMDVTIYGLSGDPAADMAAMKKLIFGLETQARSLAKELTEDRNYLMNEGKDIGAFLQYNLNPGQPGQETRAGTFLRISEKSAAFFQFSARSVPMKKSEILKMHTLVDPNGGEDPRRRRR